MPQNDFSTGLYEQNQYKKKALLSQMDGGVPTDPYSGPAATTSPVGDPNATLGQAKGEGDPYSGPAATTSPVSDPNAPPPQPKGTAPIDPYVGPDHTTGGPADPFGGFDPKGGTTPPAAPAAAPKPDLPSPGPGQPSTPVPPNQGVPTPEPAVPPPGDGGYTGPEHTGGPIGPDGQPIPQPGEKPPTSGIPPITNPGPGIPPPVNPMDEAARMRRQALIDQMTQGTGVSVDDPNIKQQLDPYAAAMERARREEVNRGAESAFANGQDFGSPEAMAAAERAGQQVGLKGSELVGQELTAKRAEIQHALDSLGQDASEDQKNQLTMKLAELDAQLKREGYGVETAEGAAERASREAIAKQENDTKIKALDSETGWRTYIADLEAKSKAQALAEGGRQADQQAILERYKTDKSFDASKYQTDRGFDMDKLRLDADTLIRNLGLQQTGTLANRELDIRDKLGMAGLNAEMTRMLLQDRQFRDRLGFDISAWQADQNRQALLSQMPQ